MRPTQTCDNELALAIESRARMPFVGTAVVPHVAAASSLLRATVPASLIVLRGGASVGPIKMGPISVDLLLGPGGCAAASPSHACVYCSWTPNAYTHSHSPSHSDRNALTQPLRLALHGRYSWPEPRTFAARACVARQVRRAQRGGRLVLRHEPGRFRSEYA